MWLAPAAVGRLALQLSDHGTTVPLPALGGKLAGYLEAATAAADRRGQLDALAADFVATVNGWSAGGVDANGAAGVNLMEAPTGAGSIPLG